MIDTEPLMPDSGEDEGAAEPRMSEPSDSRLVRLKKSIVVGPDAGGRIDEAIVNFRFYNSFNYNLVSKGQDVNLTLGVTSANPGEGKTLVASNLAVSFALGYQKETVLVDLHAHRPRIHEVFGTPLGPGLIESFRNGAIQVARTRIEHLCILPAGHFAGQPLGVGHRGTQRVPAAEPSVGLEQLAAFRDIIYSLEQEFDCIVVDMPPMNSQSFPTLFANQLNGILVVIDAGRTKRGEVERMFHQVNDRQVIGFVMNRSAT